MLRRERHFGKGRSYPAVRFVLIGLIDKYHICDSICKLLIRINNVKQKVSSKNRTTQAKAARRANVSQAMVSYVLNDTSTVSMLVKTRQCILQAMDELGYMPNRAARVLRTNKPYPIATIIPDITNFHDRRWCPITLTRQA